MPKFITTFHINMYAWYVWLFLITFIYNMFSSTTEYSQQIFLESCNMLTIIWEFLCEASCEVFANIR